MPLSSTCVKRGRAALESGAPAAKRRKKNSPSPCMGWSGTGATKRFSGGLHGCCECRVACGLPTSLRAFATFLGGRWLLPIYAPRHTFGEMHLFRCKSRARFGVCVCGTCGSKRCVRHWVPLDREVVCKWLNLGLNSRATFKSCAARRKALKDKGKGKGRVVPIRQSRVSNPGTVGIVPPSEGEDSAASFQGPTGLNVHHVFNP